MCTEVDAPDASYVDVFATALKRYSVFCQMVGEGPIAAARMRLAAKVPLPRVGEIA